MNEKFVESLNVKEKEEFLENHFAGNITFTEGSRVNAAVVDLKTES